MQLCAVGAADVERMSASGAGWVLASKFALELVARQLVVPTLAWRNGRLDARWAASVAAADEMQKIALIAASMAPSGYAVPWVDLDNEGVEVTAQSLGRVTRSWDPELLLREFLNATADALVRVVNGGPQLPSLRRAIEPTPMLVSENRTRKTRRAAAYIAPIDAASVAQAAAWPTRFSNALTSHDASFEAAGFAERRVPEEIARWSAPAIGAADRLRACFRLEIVDAKGALAAKTAPFVLRFFLQAPDDPSLQVSAREVWLTRGDRLQQFGKAFRDPQEALLEALGRAARLFAPIAAALTVAAPTEVRLDPMAAWNFFSQGAAALSDAGFAVVVPAELTVTGQRRMRARMRIGAATRGTAGVVAGGSATLSMDEVFAVDWEAALGDDTLTHAELNALAAQKSPLVQHRGAWIIVDPSELAALRQRLAAGPTTMRAVDALRLVLAESSDATGPDRSATLASSPQVISTGVLAQFLAQLRVTTTQGVAVPKALQATLRPYQARGLAWLHALATLSMGGCLADDMGLGKTIQLLALVLALRVDEPLPVVPGKAKARARAGQPVAVGKPRVTSATQVKLRPILLVVPTSVVGNWQAEAARFAPSIKVVLHYGPGRCADAAALSNRSTAQGGVLLLTTYGMVRRDIAWLAGVDFAMIVLDEAQNIKNANSSIASAIRQLRAPRRFALTGTPVENRLAELWSILDFANPGLLGPLAEFRRDYALPIERHGNVEVAARLRRLIAPFVLRRLKSDPTIISDLPAKLEYKMACTLTREQASLYQAVVDEEMRRIEAADGIARRGRVLALLSFLKQICNHPAQYLGDGRAAVAARTVAGRSGKLDRLTEMLDEALAAGDKALVFTQFHEMGEILTAHLTTTLGCEVLFLHGGTSQKSRTEMVARFQDPAPRSPRIFVLSVKAGGTGLNLTAANHVFHFDRWWNPAVEDQATDRAYRIGQRKLVAVHKLVCAGTVEDKIDQMLRDKKALADRVVGSGEQWITEMNSAELRELFTLAPDLAISTNETDGESAAPQLAPVVKKREVKLRL
ncbi:MAG: DEAD/DEAH box helicase [Kofleriaceae bacterium]|nr:DEAD/DEAH box helicase [Kofleriaceae bacterium]